MRLRDVYLLNGQALNDSDTVTVDLARSLKILYLRIQYQAQNGTTSNTLCKINGSVSKLQVIDGSNVLTSLSMREAQAKNCFDYRRMPFQVLSEDDDIVLYEEAIIDFRRWQGDTAFYLDTSVYQSPQLQLTHNLPISATAGFVTGTGKLTVIARVIDSGAPSRLGFVSAKEIDSFSSATAGDHNTDLPLDFPIAAIMVGDPVDANTPDNYLSNFKLTADTDSFIPINSSYADLLRQNLFEYGEFEQSIERAARHHRHPAGRSVLPHARLYWSGGRHLAGLVHRCCGQLHQHRHDYRRRCRSPRRHAARTSAARLGDLQIR